MIEQHRTNSSDPDFQQAPTSVQMFFWQLPWIPSYLPTPHLLTLSFQIPLSPAEVSMVYISLDIVCHVLPNFSLPSLDKHTQPARLWRSISPEQQRLTNLPPLNWCYCAQLKRSENKEHLSASHVYAYSNHCKSSPLLKYCFHQKPCLS